MKLVEEEIFKSKELKNYIKEFYDLKKFFEKISYFVIFRKDENGYLSLHINNDIGIFERDANVSIFYVEEKYNKIHIDKKPVGWYVFFEKKKVFYGKKLDKKILKDSVNFLYHLDVDNIIERYENDIKKLQNTLDKLKNIDKIKNE